MTNTKIFAIFGALALLVFSLSLTSAVLFTIDLETPNNGMPQTSSTVNFMFNLSGSPSELAKITDCTLYLNDVANNVSHVPGTNTFTKTGLSVDDYEWYVGCVSTAPKNLSSETRTFTIEQEPSDFEFCDDGQVGTSMIEIISIKDGKLDNEDEWEWKPLDEIEIDVKIKNTGDRDEDYTVELIFLDEDGNEADVASDDDDLEQDVSIDEDEKETITFSFEVDGDVEEQDYNLFAKVYKEGDENEQCVSLEAEDEDNTEEVKIDKKTNDVVIKDVEAPLSINCDEGFEVTAKIANIGSKDEDQVKVILYSSTLGINLQKEIDNLDEGDTDEVSFFVQLPADAESKLYKLTLSTEFDYDDKDDVYDKESDADEDYTFSVNVLGDCGKTQEPIINAVLTSDAKVGEEMTVEVSVTNKDDTTDFIVSPTGFESWAEVVSVSPSISSIAKDQTGKIIVKLKPTQAGAQSFTISVIFNGETKTQPVTVTIEEKTGLFTGAFAGFDGTLGSAGTYLILGIIALLVLIVVVLIVKLAKRPAPQEF